MKDFSITYSTSEKKCNYWSLNRYRFGFQGQEAENEIASVTGAYSFFKYRISDNRIGRFWSVDPLAKDYPWNSTYAFSENRVIDGVELEGLEYIYYKVKDVDKNGKCLLENTGVKDYKNWILNVTDGLWGTWKLETHVVLYKDGKGYLFSKDELDNVNVNDFTEDRWTEEGIDAINTLFGVAGRSLGNKVQKTTKAKSNEAVEVISNATDKAVNNTSKVIKDTDKGIANDTEVNTNTQKDNANSNNSESSNTDDEIQ